MYSKFTAPPLCLNHGARGGHAGQALARWAPAPGGRLRHCGTGLTVEVCARAAAAAGGDARAAAGFHLRQGGGWVRPPPPHPLCVQAVGKWHQGQASDAYTPTRRGFKTFLGYYQGMEDHWSHGPHRLLRAARVFCCFVRLCPN